MPEEMIIIGDYYIEKGFLKMIYNEAKEDLLTQQRRDVRKIQIERDERNRNRKEDRVYFLQQKLSGFIITLCSLLIAVLDMSPICLIFAILGLCMMKTKRKVMGTESDYIGECD